jgi:sirohydrochlorin cobaltochelatase
MVRGIVLFAHGSRDPAWARPFEEIAARVAKKFPVRLAYLELMRPTLAEAVASLASAGAQSIRVVPLFLGPGAHVSEDLPRLVSSAQAAHPRIAIAVGKPLGEQPEVIAALADAISAAVARE